MINMKPCRIYSKSGNAYILRSVNSADANALGVFFDKLSALTRTRYGPHPLTQAYANEYCRGLSAISDPVNTLVIEQIISTKGEKENKHANANNKIVGYFILTTDIGAYIHDVARYAQYGHALEQGRHWIFAPCIADNLQSSGLASAAMKAIKKWATELSISSLVLMGGTQINNLQAVAFYKKNGFIQVGEFKTEVDNIDMHLLLT